LIQKPIPIDGQFVLIGESTGNVKDYIDLSGKTPERGYYTIDKFNLQDGFELGYDYLGFDTRTVPSTIFGFSCGNLPSITNFTISGGYQLTIRPFLKPQFADLPT